MIKIYKVTKTDTNLANEKSELLDELFAIFLTEENIQIVNSPSEANYCLMIENFCLKRNTYIRDILNCTFIYQNFEKIFVINWDENANPVFRGIYSNLRQSRHHDDQFSCIPMLKYPNELVLEPQKKHSPKFLASFRGNLKSHPIRKKLMRRYLDSPLIRIEATDSWFNHSNFEKHRYVDTILNSKFSLCPPGYSVTSYRIQESMALGRCPIIIGDDYPKKILGLNIEMASIKIPKREIHNIDNILNDLEPEWQKLGRIANQEWQKINPQNGQGWLVKIILNKIYTLQKPNRRELLSFWQSNEFYKKNKWTYLGRYTTYLANKLGQR